MESTISTSLLPTTPAGWFFLLLAVMMLFVVGRRLLGGGPRIAADPAILQRLSKLEREVWQLKAALGRENGDTVTDEAPDAVTLTIAQTQGTIEAIKHVREQTGMGLKEAKDHVEALLRGSPKRG